MLLLAHVQTAVQREVRSRREGSFIAGEPGDDRGDLGGFSETVDRNALDDRIEDLGAHRANHVGPDVPGRDGIHRDALRRHLLGQRHREAVNARLGRRVVGLAELPLLPVHRRDIDNPAPLLADHPLDDLLRHVEKAREVRRNDVVPVLPRHLAEHAVARDTGIVHEHVDVADLFLHLREGRLGRVPVRDVALRRDERVAECSLLGQPPLASRRIRPAARHDSESVRVQTLAYCRSDASHSAGYVSNPLCHVFHSSSVTVSVKEALALMRQTLLSTEYYYLSMGISCYSLKSTRQNSVKGGNALLRAERT